MKRVQTHPGIILAEEFLGLPVRVSVDVILGRRRITKEIAGKLSGAFGTTPEYWLNLQRHHDAPRT